MRETQLKKRRIRRKRRAFRTRSKLTGAEDRPRLCVTRTSRHIYALLANDTTGKTITSASTLSPEIKDEISNKNKTEQAKIVGRLIAERAKKTNIEKVIFDRHGFKFIGRVKALADGAREAGLKF